MLFSFTDHIDLIYSCSLGNRIKMKNIQRVNLLLSIYYLAMWWVQGTGNLLINHGYSKLACSNELEYFFVSLITQDLLGLCQLDFGSCSRVENPSHSWLISLVSPYWCWAPRATACSQFLWYLGQLSWTSKLPLPYRSLGVYWPHLSTTAKRLCTMLCCAALTQSPKNPGNMLLDLIYANHVSL